MLLQSPKGIGARGVQQSVLWLPLVKSGRNQRLFDQTGDCVKDLSIVGALFARDMPRSLQKIALPDIEDRHLPFALTRVVGNEGEAPGNNARPLLSAIRDS